MDAHTYMYSCTCTCTPHAWHAWKLHAGCGMKIALGDIIVHIYVSHAHTWNG